jgi:branched-chain amino acid transport system ATP-binding protein
VTALEIDGVVKRFGGNLALDDVALGVERGEIHAVIGPNGAGKSTLFGVISGEHAPERGAIRLGGRDVTSMSPSGRVRLGVARAFQVARVFPDLTVQDNVVAAVVAATGGSRVLWSSRPLRAARIAATDALAQMRLAALGGRRARELSQGDRKRLEIAMVLVTDPSVLLLDEPTAGMSPEETQATVALIRELWTERGLTVLLTEHDMQVVFDLAQRLTVLHLGRVLMCGDPAEVRASDEVARVYLGGGGGGA